MEQAAVLPAHRVLYGKHRVRYAIGWTRFVVIIGSLSSVVVGTLLFIAAAAEVGMMIVHLFEAGLGSHDVTQELVVTAVRSADTVLIGAALIITGIGLYALFVDQVESLPTWLQIGSLEDLKNHLVSVVVAVLAVDFFTRVVEWGGGSDILYLGAGIALVIASLAAFNLTHSDKH